MKNQYFEGLFCALIAIASFYCTAGNETDAICVQVYEQIHGNKQAELLPQETMRKLVWLKYHCFKTDRGKQDEFEAYMKMGGEKGEKCDYDSFKARTQREMAIPSRISNLFFFVHAYNELFFDFCRTHLTEQLAQSGQKLALAEREFAVRAKTILDVVDTRAKDAGIEIDYVTLRLRTALLMIHQEADLQFMQDKKLSYEEKKRQFREIFQAVVVQKCLNFIVAIGRPIIDLVLAGELSQSAPRIGNLWVDVHSLCAECIDADELKIEEKWFEFGTDELNRKIPLSQLEKLEAKTEKCVRRDGRIYPAGENVAHIKAMLDKHRAISESEKDPTPLSLRESLHLISQMKIFFEARGETQPVTILENHQRLAIVGPMNCIPATLKHRHLLEVTIQNSNIKRYAQFHNSIQKEICLEALQLELAAKVKRFDEASGNSTKKLETISLSAFELFKASILMVPYRISAALSYLMRYSELGLKISGRKLWALFEANIRLPCLELLEAIDLEVRALNMLLELSAERTSRSNLLDQETRYNLLRAQVCRHLLYNIDDKKLFKFYRPKGGTVYDDMLEEDQMVSERRVRLNDIELYFDPTINADLGPPKESSKEIV